MDLRLSVEQAMLAETARAFVARRCPVERVRAIVSRASAFDAELWTSMASLGWAGLTVSADDGGAGQGAAELVVLCEALGTGPVPSPLIASALATVAIAAAGTADQRSRWLPALASGAAIGTLALLEAAGDDEWDEPRLVTGGDGAAGLRGTKVLVPWASCAALIVVSTADGLFVVDAGERGAGVSVARHDDIGADPLFAVEFDGAAAEALGDGDLAGQTAAVRRLLDWAAVMQLGYVVGAADRALEITVRHARTRHQFGRPIGSFQAVAHRCVDMRTDLDACRFLAYRAACALDTGGPADLEVAAAKAYANVAMRRLFGHAHQVHGAVGFSTECDLHLFTRYAKAFELSYGSTDSHLDRVAAAMGLG